MSAPIQTLIKYVVIKVQSCAIIPQDFCLHPVRQKMPGTHSCILHGKYSWVCPRCRVITCVFLSWMFPLHCWAYVSSRDGKGGRDEVWRRGLIAVKKMRTKSLVEENSAGEELRQIDGWNRWVAEKGKDNWIVGAFIFDEGECASWTFSPFGWAPVQSEERADVKYRPNESLTSAWTQKGQVVIKSI